jgi:hypothetical protein
MEFSAQGGALQHAAKTPGSVEPNPPPQELTPEDTH